MIDDRIFAVYMLTNKSNKVLYIGVTNNLQRRIDEHRAKAVPGFTALYNCNKLVYVEFVEDVYSAITREKELKGWTRKKKNVLIEAENPEYTDLYDSYFP